MKITFQNDTKLKEYMVEETIAHRKADRLIKGTYADDDSDSFKGCAVGCAIESLNKKLGTDYSHSNHSVLADNGLYPEWLARLEDTLFEGLPTAESQTWPERFTKAIPVGVSFESLEKVKWQFSAYLMKENIERVLTLDIDATIKEQVLTAIRGVLALHENAITTGQWDESAAESAARSAESAARSAWSAWSAWSAAESAWSAASSARSAARSAESAARSAWSAWSAWSAAESAWSAAYVKHSEELLRLLSEVEN
jgi:hypothetical protein